LHGVPLKGKSLRRGFLPHEREDEFKQYYSLSAKLIDEMTKERLAEVARMLALHVADYEARFGGIPRSALLGLLGVSEISQEHAKLLRDGMQTLTAYIALTLDDDQGDDADMVH